MNTPILQLELPGVKKLRSGKVRDIFDLGDGPSGAPGAEVVEPLESFVSSVSERPSAYTDLLLAPRGLPGLDGLLARLRPAG